MFDIISSDLEQLEKVLLQELETSVELVNNVGRHLVTSGGKRLRPAACLLAAHSGPSFQLAKAMPLAASLELIHTASLVHDDVIDKSDTRRGRPTANAKWGNKISILSGDYIFARALHMVANRGYDNYIFTQLSQLICQLSIGEILQDESVYKIPDRESYNQRIKNKTADFIAICCELGALVGGMSKEAAQKMYTYGESIGMAFQITDDILDVTSDEAKIGKPAGADIQHGIITLPVMRALEVSPVADELHSIVTNRDMTEADCQRALAIVKDCDAVDYALQVTDDYLAKAVASLPQEMPEEYKESFRMVADFIGNRDF